MEKHKPGLDIDGVLAKLAEAWCLLFDLEPPTEWDFDPKMGERFKKMKDLKILDEFYLNLEPELRPFDLDFDVHCYITGRPVTPQVTEEWLLCNGYQPAPVFTSDHYDSKVSAYKNSGCTIFLDDAYHNFKDISEADGLCYLLSKPYNEMYDVGEYRVDSITEFNYIVNKGR